MYILIFKDFRGQSLLKFEVSKSHFTVKVYCISLDKNFSFTDYDDLENAEIIGDKGKIKLNAPFWCPTRVTTTKAVLDFEMPVVDMPLKFTNSSGFRFVLFIIRYLLHV